MDRRQLLPGVSVRGLTGRVESPVGAVKCQAQKFEVAKKAAAAAVAGLPALVAANPAFALVSMSYLVAVKHFAACGRDDGSTHRFAFMTAIQLVMCCSMLLVSSMQQVTWWAVECNLFPMVWPK